MLKMFKQVTENSGKMKIQLEECTSHYQCCFLWKLNSAMRLTLQKHYQTT